MPVYFKGFGDKKAKPNFKGIEEYLYSNLNKESHGLHIFPELFLTGYPLQDLCLQKPFIDKYHRLLERLTSKLPKLIDQEKCCLLIGGIKYNLNERSLPISIQNVVYQVGLGKKLDDIYTKQLLPNYDIFDEKKYFKRGTDSFIGEFFGKKVGILICEDMWASSFHEWDPVHDLMEKKKKLPKGKLDLTVNLSGSPFHINKHQKRVNRAKEISHLLNCPFAYSNRVGAEDEVIFDGGSFVIDGDKVLVEAKRFTTDLIQWEYSSENGPYTEIKKQDTSQTWEGLFNSRLELSTTPPTLEPLSDDQCMEILQALTLGIQDYAQKNQIIDNGQEC